jgi:hypothetical protein
MLQAKPGGFEMARRKSDNGDGEGGTATKVQNGIYVPVGRGALRERITTEAAAAGVTDKEYVRELLRTHFGLPVELVPTRTRYASDEERKQAKAVKQTARNAVIAKLLEENAERFQALLAEAEANAKAKVAAEAAA